jgi:hypothetical protein
MLPFYGKSRYSAIFVSNYQQKITESYKKQPFPYGLIKIAIPCSNSAKY